MTPSELRRRVTLDTCAAAAALAVPAAWIGGAPAGLGVLAGGVLAIVNFRWLAARAAAATAAPSATAGTGSGAASAWLVGSGLRFGASLAACTLLLATGWAHPIGLLAGFTVLPCDLIVRGLAAARVEG
jgi:ATP synthase I subunit